MIEYKSGDLLKSTADALVNPVNCVGVMGKGLALQFKQQFPDNFKAYKKVCEAGQLKPGRMFITSLNQIFNPKFIINFPTKRHWRDLSNLEDIESGLVALRLEVIKFNISSIAIPPLGCGLGALDWYQVLPLIVSFANSLPATKTSIFSP